MYPKPVCKPECPKRKPGCHGTCKEYKDWRNLLWEEKRRMNKEKKMEQAIDQILHKERWDKE